MIRLRIKEICEEKKMSQRKLSKLTGMDIKNIQRIFRNPYSVVTTDTLDRIAEALNVDARELIESIPTDD